MRGRRKGGAEESAEVGAEGTDENEALGETVGAAGVAIPLAATGGLTEAEPAGGPIAGAEESVGIDERFDDDWFVGIASAPVGGETTGHLAEEAGREKLDLDPGESRHKVLILQVLWGRG